MVDRVVEGYSDDIPEIDERLQAVLITALKEAKQKLERGEEVVPFTALAVKDNLFLETHPGDSSDEYYAAARHTVQHASGADAYAFCYDGYVETDEGTEDVLIAEGGLSGEDEGVAIGFFYQMPDRADSEEGAPVVDSEPIYIGPAPNFMAFLITDDQADVGEDDPDAFEDFEGETDPSVE
ncbi:hypothetical protein [Cryptobacterium curtum]|uniref:hypothetical protein n=1 Tax=Cryptobacterium curtum TaxID=84163 RepID=UPI0028D5A309|nr:hypothetical protein [Cryptobacterium curtum]